MKFNDEIFQIYTTVTNDVRQIKLYLFKNRGIGVEPAITALVALYVRDGNNLYFS